MDKFTFVFRKRSFSFGIDTQKYLIGENEQLKYDMVRTLRKTYSNHTDVDVIKDHDMGTLFTLNDSTINHRASHFVEISPFTNMSDMLKLKSKTISASILAGKLETIEMSETFNTIKILYEDFENELNELLDIKASQFDTQIRLLPWNSKTISKLVTLDFVLDGEPISDLDLPYEEHYLMQLGFVFELDSLIDDGHIIVYLDVPHLSSKINHFIIGKSWSRTYFLISTRSAEVNEAKDLLIVKDKIVDLADDMQVYDHYVLNSSKDTTIEAMRAEVLSAINRDFANSYQYKS